MQISRGLIRLIFILSLILACNIGIGMPAYAGISVEPVNTEIVVQPGSVTKGVFIVKNEADKPVHVKVEPEDWLKMRLGKTTTPLDKWFSVTPLEFDIEPLGTREVQYAVAPPDDAKEELATMVYFATTSPMGTFSITSRIGCSIYAAIAERFILGCNIKDVWVAANTKKGPGGETIYEGITFTIEAENTGNVHLRPTGNIVITAGDGTKYDVLIMRGFPAYPGHGEKYTARWNKADIPAGTYEAEINLDYGNIYSVEKIVKAKKTFVVKNEDGVL